MNQSTLFRSQRVRWITLALLLAAFAALLTTTFALAQSDSTTINYAENGKGPVANLAAMDPEDDAFTWDATPGGFDGDLFKIDKDTGVLSFNDPPDYENPKDNGRNNSYNVEVKATQTNNSENVSKMFTVTVNVTNVEEDGKLTWTADNMKLVQFEVGAELLATLTDGDVQGSSKTPSPITWQWYRSDSMADMGTAIAGETTDTYTAADADVGQYLSVKAMYNVGGGAEDMVTLTAEYPVLATREGNTPPEFSPASVAREIDEGMKGMTVGNPVTATDDGSGELTYSLDGDDETKFAINWKTGQITTTMDLNYEDNDCGSNHECTVDVMAKDSAGASSDAATVTITLKNVDEDPDFEEGLKTIQTDENRSVLYGTGAVTLSDVTYAAMDPEGGNVNLTLTGTDAALFSLESSGELKFVSQDGPDYEKPRDRNRDNTYEVTVRASDGNNDTDHMVMVKVINVDEGPDIKGDSKVNYKENGTSPVRLNLTATDPEGDVVTWSLPTGTDIPVAPDAPKKSDGTDIVADDAAQAALFNIDPKTGEITFSSPPNFETPETGVTDNEYKIVVKAEASGIGYKDVVITVTDDTAEKPKITIETDASNGRALRQFDQAVGATATEIHAVLVTTALGTTYAPSVASDTTPPPYQWYTANSRTTTGGTPIDGQTNAAYTLQEADVGKYLYVVHNYTTGTEPNLKRGNVRAVTERHVAAVRTTEEATSPVFDPPAPKRNVNEGKKGMKAGSPVTAKDVVAKRPLYYDLTGTDDDDKFQIDPKTGQITTEWVLDSEATVEAPDATTPGHCEITTNDDPKKCTVTVTAYNSSGEDSGDAIGTAIVTISIKNVNEEPTFDHNEVLETAIKIEENMTDLKSSADVAMVNFTAKDPEGGNVTYRLMGLDSALFKLDSGRVLSLKAKPDYEMPADSNKDNTYEVTVQASDASSLRASHKIRVMVTDKDEPPKITGAAPPEAPAQDKDGKVTLSAAAPMSGKAITAMLRDPDGHVASSVVWQWSKSMTMSGDFTDITDATSITYTPVAADEGYYLKATASYNDGHGSDKMADATTTAPVAAGIPANLDKFDTNNNGGIEKVEVLDAIDDYLDGGEGAPTKQEILDLIDYYLDSLQS